MTARPEDWKLLGLAPGAEIAHVKRAYRHRISLYDPSSLATYNLLDEGERETMLSRINEAYRRIVGYEPPPTAPQELAETLPPTAEVPSGLVPDPTLEPGAHLRHRRLSQGLTLQRIASETKIAVAILEQIEAEDFDALPAPAYARGHVQQYAREIHIDKPDEFAGFFAAKMKDRSFEG